MRSLDSLFDGAVRGSAGEQPLERGLLKADGGGGRGVCAVSGGAWGETTDIIFHACFFLLAFLGSESRFFFFFFLTCETSDIYRLNFICVSVRHLGHSL